MAKGCYVLYSSHGINLESNLRESLGRWALVLRFSILAYVCPALKHEH